MNQVLNLEGLVEKQAGWSKEIANLPVKVPFHEVPNPEWNVRPPFYAILDKPVHILYPFASLGGSNNKPPVRHFFNKLLQRNGIVTHVDLAYERDFRHFFVRHFQRNPGQSLSHGLNATPDLSPRFMHDLHKRIPLTVKDRHGRL